MKNLTDKLYADNITSTPMKRYLYLLHRCLGVSLCLFMALWFVSGVVMTYVCRLPEADRDAAAGSPARPR